MKRFGVILLCFFFFGCTKESDENTFKRAEKINTDTGFVSAVAFDKNERTVCLGVQQSDDSIVAADVSSIKKKDILTFQTSNEFLLVEEAPGHITMEKNCVYVKRGYADSAKESVEVGVIAYTVKGEKLDAAKEL